MALQAYRRFLERNSTAVASLEALISNVTWLLPERFSASETPAEALNSVSGLFSVFNEHLLRKGPERREQLLLACLYQVRLRWAGDGPFVGCTVSVMVQPVRPGLGAR